MRNESGVRAKNAIGSRAWRRYHKAVARQWRRSCGTSELEYQRLKKNSRKVSIAAFLSNQSRGRLRYDQRGGGMEMKRYFVIAFLSAAILSVPAYAQTNNSNTGLNRARGTVDNIRQADPPTVSTSTVVTPQAPVHQMPNGGSDVHRMRTNPPPSPSTSGR
ncbi:hypothetical protein ACFFWD_13075 [Bradyrhizobium erythrophlei]|uniref:hypothetical protein n=1 Tax=Bradyrhizobium erythrophlei TaxID=1437360 RepID=UPI0035EA6C54